MINDFGWPTVIILAASKIKLFKNYIVPIIKNFADQPDMYGVASFKQIQMKNQKMRKLQIVL
jgi:hypothetical protein